ncbi:hypothetical protein LROSL1_0299 [Furfurilactobacillus rossiae]|uniref:hypothetical protein n=1 Tax=Furfurilactobacillus rossiae TaxID=231049 RepID=UPI0015BCFF36|nr:hypothetical protein [Furfurilactobacillus rossiae]MCF6165757.1 hypothetical protein [Furfurilactobacillus rossiae]QLE63119.1 hypothetical protein LROSL1_0299 [Furfurilactobacillus rossiae]
MAKFNEAVYRQNGVERVINVDDIVKQSSYVDVVEHLYCPGKGCHAKLVFNRKSNGTNYLSKHKGYEHDTKCPYFSDSEIVPRAETEYIEEDGALSDDGINRRKKQAQSELMSFLNPQTKTKKATPGDKPKARNKTVGNGEKNIVIQLRYDPNADGVENNNNLKVREPAFYNRLPQQISELDSFKNLKTSARILAVDVSEQDNFCTILGELGSTKIKFIFPEAFFANTSSVVSSQLSSFFETLSQFVKNVDTELYITTLCQTREVDMTNLQVYVYTSNFLSFQTRRNTYNSLDAIAIAISRNSVL